jgi:uncharacterized phage protein (TIGR02218 family)
MKVFAASLLAAYKSECSQISTCSLITRTDLVKIGATDSDGDIVIDGVTYSGEFGANPTQLSKSNDLKVDNTSLSSTYSFDDDGVTDQDLKNGLYDNAKVIIFQVNLEDLPTALTNSPRKHNLMFDGYIGRVTKTDRQWTFEVASKVYKLGQKTGEVTSQSCRNTLGDDRCTVVLTPFTNSHTVTAVASRSLFTANNTQIDDYYAGGVVTWISGNNVGFRAEPFTYSSSEFYIEQAPYPIQIGDTFSAVIGCNKEGDTCRDVFNNKVNFQAEEDVRGESFYATGRG